MHQGVGLNANLSDRMRIGRKIMTTQEFTVFRNLRRQIFIKEQIDYKGKTLKRLS
jgi:hypothetical protein